MSWQADALNRLDDLIEAGNRLRNDGTVQSHATFIGWSTRAQVALETLVGANHTYTAKLEELYDENAGSHAAVEVLAALRSDIEHGYLRKVANIISAEAFADFLEMAGYLVGEGYKDPAASLCGAVLEDGLRRISGNNDIPVAARDDLTSLRDKCAQKGVFNNLVRQQITAWTTLRNAADHGKFGEYDTQHVRSMIDGVRSFLGNHLN